MTPLLHAVQRGGNQHEDDRCRDRRAHPLSRAELVDERAAENEYDAEDDDKHEGEAEIGARPAPLVYAFLSALGQRTSSPESPLIRVGGTA